ncbi:LytR C-terminal domain-containing protein [Streptomyces sp. NPDC005438]|uniref:LytR C-terminal domain-containing protein n=1 Tax=Streptomyces sp. NPDC005438 TaxID=3156880 RepID=UPI0033BB88DE
MSMLTPPGMGGKYRIKGNAYPRMRRPRRRPRAALAVVASVAALGVLGWGTFQLVDVFSGEDGSRQAEARDRARCEKKVADAKPRPDKAADSLPKPSSIKVNVYNATTKKGLAKKTADQLKKRGFRVGKVDNAPDDLDKKVKGTGLLRAAPGAETAGRFRVLGTQLAKADTRHDDRDGEDVDLVIGDKFTGLAKEGRADKALQALASPSPKPSGC